MNMHGLYEDTKNMIYAQLKCPITGLYYHDPVVSDEGVIYERMAIEHYLTHKNSKSRLIPVPIIKEIINKIDSGEKFLLKKPYFLFKTDFINDLSKKNITELVKYTNIVLTDFYDKIQKTTIGSTIITNINDNSVIKHIINNSIDFDTFDVTGMKLIHYASITSNQDIIKFLIEDKSVDTLQKDKDGNYPVHSIAKNINEIDKISHIFTKENLLKENDKGLNSAHIICKYVNNNNSKTRYNLIKSIVCDRNMDVYSKIGMLPVHYIFRFGQDYNILDKILDYITPSQHTKSGEDIHDLLCKNIFITKTEKNSLIYKYFSITNTPQIDESSVVRDYLVNIK